mgnify:CR=1 FL=1
MFEAEKSFTSVNDLPGGRATIILTAFATNLVEAPAPSTLVPAEETVIFNAPAFSLYYKLLIVDSFISASDATEPMNIRLQPVIVADVVFVNLALLI